MPILKEKPGNRIEGEGQERKDAACPMNTQILIHLQRE
jgi:hypothetical protein